MNGRMVPFVMETLGRWVEAECFVHSFTDDEAERKLIWERLATQLQFSSADIIMRQIA
eukprot:gene15647-biopygen4346